MISKLFEIRDRATFIPMMATHLIVNEKGEAGEAEHWLLCRAGYAKDQTLISEMEPYIILTKLDGVDSEYDPFAWYSSRISAVHNYIIAHWPELKTGQVIDIEYILGESEKPKVSERFS